MINKCVCAVMVTYNRLEILKKTLSYLESQTIPIATIIIVDNNSSDGTKSYLKSIQNKSNIECIFLDSNMGVGYGLSIGTKHGLQLRDYDYFWMLDDDTYYEKDTLYELITNIEKTDFAMLGLTSLNPSWSSKNKIVMPKLQPVEYVLIDGALLKTEAIRKVGTLKENYFMMCADDEYIIRLKKNGYKIGLLDIDAVKRLHLGGDGAFTKATLWRGYYSSRNNLLILKQYFSFKSLFKYLVKQFKFIFAAAVFAPDRFLRVRLRLLGIWHGIKGVEGKTLDPETLKFE